MIILEGPDGAGKTTLIKRLSEDLGIEIAPRACTSEGGPVDDLWRWTAHQLNEKSYYNTHVTLHDRHPLISEPIYGPLIRGSMAEGFNAGWYSEAWKIFLSFRPIIIFCLPDVETVVKNVQAEHKAAQMDGVAFNIRAIYWLYYNLMTRLRGTRETPTILWDYEDRLSEPTYEHILEHLRLDIQTR